MFFNSIELGVNNAHSLVCAAGCADEGTLALIAYAGEEYLRDFHINQPGHFVLIYDAPGQAGVLTKFELRTNLESLPDKVFTGIVSSLSSDNSEIKSAT